MKRIVFIAMIALATLTSGCTSSQSEEQQEFIEKISPLLDCFYGVKKEDPKKR